MINLRFLLAGFLIVVSFSSFAQTWDWTNYLTEGGNDYVTDVETGPDGSVYISARARNDVLFSNANLRNDSCSIFTPFIGDSDMAVAKYDKHGKLIWARRDGSFDPSTGLGVALDSEGNIVSCGSFFNEFYFGQDTIRVTFPDSSFVMHPFICKYNKDGNRLWARAGKILNGRDRVNSIAYEVAVNSHDDVLATGFIQGRAVFESDTIGVDNLLTAFVVSYDKDGNLNWAKSTEIGSRAYEVVVNSKNEIIIGGERGLTQNGVLLEKRKIDGELLWRKESFPVGGDRIYSVKLSENEQIYFSGIYNDSLTLDSMKITIPSDDNGMFLGKLSQNGELAFLKQLFTCDSTLELVHPDMAVLKNMVLIGGTFWGNLYFEGDTITSAGDADGFIACFDTLGNYKWVKHLDGNPVRTGGVKNSDGIRGLKLDQDNNLFVCGYLKDSIRFDSAFFPGVRGTTGFVGKLFLPIEPEVFMNDSNLCEGDSTTFGARGNGSPLTYEWNFESGDPNIFVGANPVVSFDTPGEYDIQLIVSNPYTSDTLYIEDFLINSNPLVDIGSDTMICEDNILLIDAGQGFSSYIWSTGDSTSRIEVDATGNYSIQVVDSNNCIGQDTISVIVDPCSNTDQLIHAEIKTFPNPSTGHFTFEMPFSNSLVYIYDINGKLIFKKELNSFENSIDLTGINSSLLLYKVFVEDMEIFEGKLVLIK